MSSSQQSVPGESPELLSYMKHAKDMWDRQQEFENRNQRIIDDDSAFDGFATENSVYENRSIDISLRDREHYPSMWVRASVYRNSYIANYREILLRGTDSSDRNRPVIMRGSRYACIRQSHAAYSSWGGGGDSPTYWARRVLDRYVSYIKYTCFDSGDHVERGRDILNKVARKIGGMGRDHLCDVLPFPGKCGWSHGKQQIWLSGKLVTSLSNHQVSYIKRLWRISKKMETLELKRQVVKLPG